MLEEEINECNSHLCFTALLSVTGQTLSEQTSANPCLARCGYNCFIRRLFHSINLITKFESGKGFWRFIIFCAFWRMDSLWRSPVINFLWLQDSSQQRPQSCLSFILCLRWLFSCSKALDQLGRQLRGNPSVSISGGMKKNDLARSEVTSNLSQEAVTQHNCVTRFSPGDERKTMEGDCHSEQDPHPLCKQTPASISAFLMCIESLCRKRMCSWQVQSCKGIVWTCW